MIEKRRSAFAAYIMDWVKAYKLITITITAGEHDEQACYMEQAKVQRMPKRYSTPNG